MKPTPLKIILAVLALIITLALTKDLIIKSIVQSQASKVLGAPVHIQWMAVGLMKQTIRIKGIRVDHPQGFPKGVLIDIPQAGVDYDMLSIFKGNLHLRLVILNMKEMTVLRNKEGKLNVDALKISPARGGMPGARKPKDDKLMPLAIDTVELNLGKVIYQDHATKPPTTRNFDLGIRDKTYHNITNAQEFAMVVMLEALRRTAIKNIALFGAEEIFGTVKHPFKSVNNIFQGVKKLIP